MNKKIIISFCLSLLMTLFAAPAIAQNQTVTGTVVDETGEPIIGASVMVVGSKTGTVTDLDGNYSLSAPKGAKVTITFIGYIPQTVVPGGTVKLAEDTESLEEVVVVGYGTQKKAHLTGSVATVPVDEIQDLASAGLASTLSGLVNGLDVSGGDSRPGERATMYIRDTNSLSAATGDATKAQEPLFVIDGYIYPNDVKIGNDPHRNLGAEAFNNLDPSEVESISVLKDASAAVYGARAANGVILVTTKRGKSGKPSISYSGTFGFTNEVSRPKMLSTYNWGRLYNAYTAADPTNTSLNHTTALYQMDELNAMKKLNYDLLDKYWDTAFMQKHAVNISGASDNVSYFGSVSYFDQDGNLGKLDYNRWNYRAGLDIKISKWLSASLNVSGDYGKKNTPNVKVGGSGNEKDYNLLLTRPGYIPEYIDDMGMTAFGITNGMRNQNQYYNFNVLQNNGDYKRNMTSNTNINAGLTYDFGWNKYLKGLTLRFTYSKSINNEKGNEYGSGFTLYQMNRRYGSGAHMYTPTAGDDPTFDYLDPSNFTALTLSNGDGGGYLARTTSRSDNYQINFTAQYQRQFAEKHDVSALFSVEKSEAESEYLRGERLAPYPFTTGQSNSAEGDTDTQFSRAESGTLSYIGRINYAYDNRYLFEFLLRTDASTKFAPKNYWGVFPAVSAGWVMSEEKWFKEAQAVKWIDFLKVRASWGLTGRDNVTAWQWMQVYAQDKDKGAVFGEDKPSVNRITINSTNSAVNSDIHWDKAYKTNVGFDLRVLQQRLNITFDYYYEKNREMLMAIKKRQDDFRVPTTVGTPTADLNFGKMDSWGWELGITWRDKIGKDFKYRIGINTGYSDNKVIDADWDKEADYRKIHKNHRTDLGLWGLQCIGMFRTFQDIEEYFNTYMLKEDGTYGTYLGYTKDQMRPGMLIYKDVRGDRQEDGTYAGPDHKIDADLDQVHLGCRSNIYGFTMNLGADWKGISLTAQLGAHWGGYTTVPGAALKPTGYLDYCNMPSFWNPDDMYVYQDIVDGEGNVVMKQNREAKYPVIAAGGVYSVNSQQSSFWRVSAARVSLNRLTLAYSIPSKLFKGVGIKSARINVTGQNLINFYNPYPDNFMNPMAGNYGNYPNLRKWTIGVNLSF